MSKQTFIVSDESRNSHDMVVLTAGIDCVDFARNPIMYYMHDRHSGVIGRWENIRTKNSQLLMDAVFDDSTPLSQQVKKQVDKGFLRCASIGIDKPEWEMRDGVRVVVKCRLREVSIVDIPANRNAIRLLDEQGGEVYTFAEWTGLKSDALRKTIIACLGLPDRSNDSEILNALEMRLNSPKMPEDAVSRAVRLNYIEEADREQYMSMAMADAKAFDELVARKEARTKARFDGVLMQAVRAGRLDAKDMAIFDEVAQSCGYALCERVLSLIPQRRMVTAMIQGNSGGVQAGIPPRSVWGLSEYRKYAPKELEDNPELYMELMERDGQFVPLSAESLDYYRKHNPKYLADHPQEYKRALEDKKLKGNYNVKH